MTLLDTRVQRVAAAVVLLLALALPILDAPFLLDLANQVLLAVIGSVALMLVNASPDRSRSATPGSWPPAPSPPASGARAHGALLR
jgi:hypothetical protein